MNTERQIIAHDNPKSPISEAYRTLRTNIQFANIDKEIKTIVITSSTPSEGKSTVISNLAVTMAQSGKKTLLIDCDLRKPRIHQVFDKPNGNKGMSTILADNIDYKKAIMATEVENLELLSSGPIPPNPSEILASQKMKNFLEQAKKDYDMILIDAPPVGVVTDAAILSTIVDGTILVCAVGQAIVEAVKNAKNLLENVGANILGVVANKIPVTRSGYYRYHYYTYNDSYYDDEHTEKAK